MSDLTPEQSECVEAMMRVLATVVRHPELLPLVEAGLAETSEAHGIDLPALLRSMYASVEEVADKVGESTGLPGAAVLLDWAVDR